jgi:hypothetical protein
MTILITLNMIDITQITHLIIDFTYKWLHLLQVNKNIRVMSRLRML